MNPNPLDQLKDIHLPTEVNWWPLAPGWWMLAVLLLLGLFALWKVWRKVCNDSRQFKQIMIAVDELEVEQNLDDREWLAALSALLRQLAINIDGRQESAGLVGQEWLTYLDQRGDTSEFSKGVGSVLASSPYQKTVEYDRAELLTLTRNWLKAQPKRGAHHA